MKTGSLIAISALLFSTAAVSADDKAVDALLKKSNCMKCHSVDKKKDGPSFKDVAAKYKGKADAENTIYTHITSMPTIKIDGVDEQHDALKTKKEDEARAVAKWILSR